MMVMMIMMMMIMMTMMTAIMGTLNNDDNNIVEKQLVLRAKQQLCTRRASRFLVHFFDVHCTTTT